MLCHIYEIMEERNYWVKIIIKPNLDISESIKIEDIKNNLLSWYRSTDLPHFRGDVQVIESKLRLIGNYSSEFTMDDQGCIMFKMQIAPQEVEMTNIESGWESTPEVLVINRRYLLNQVTKVAQIALSLANQVNYSDKNFTVTLCLNGINGMYLKDRESPGPCHRTEYIYDRFEGTGIIQGGRVQSALNELESALILTFSQNIGPVEKRFSNC